MKVLIVDDSNVVRDRIVEMLSGITGVEIAGEATNSIEAIHMVNKLKPDVVTLDIRIPGESGIEVLKKIKRTQPSTTVLVFTWPQHGFGPGPRVRRGVARLVDGPGPDHNR